MPAYITKNQGKVLLPSLELCVRACVCVRVCARERACARLGHSNIMRENSHNIRSSPIQKSFGGQTLYTSIFLSVLGESSLFKVM